MRALPFAFVALAAAPALADEALEPTQEAALSARLGSMLPFSTTPGTPASNVRSFGTYDAAQKRTVLGLDTTAMFASWFQLQAGALYEDSEIHSHVLAEFGLLEDDKQGLDLQLGVGWRESGINGVSEGRAMLAVGHELAHTYITGGATFDVGANSARGLAVNAAAIHTITDDLYAGIDSRLQVELEHGGADPMKSMAEPTWQLYAGPVVTYVVRKYTVTASGGVAADKPRAMQREVGMFGEVGLGTAF